MNLLFISNKYISLYKYSFYLGLIPKMKILEGNCPCLQQAHSQLTNAMWDKQIKLKGKVINKAKN